MISSSCRIQNQNTKVSCIFIATNNVSSAKEIKKTIRFVIEIVYKNILNYKGERLVYWKL